MPPPWHCLGTAPARLVRLLGAPPVALGASALLGGEGGHWVPSHCLGARVAASLVADPTAFDPTGGDGATEAQDQTLEADEH
eukprot:scaffold133156_cov30-Phaeocystis_antarctica.AAC.1